MQMHMLYLLFLVCTNYRTIWFVVALTLLWLFMITTVIIATGSLDPFIVGPLVCLDFCNSPLKVIPLVLTAILEF